MTLVTLKSIGQVFSWCPSAGICWVFFSWLAWTWWKSPSRASTRVCRPSGRRAPVDTVLERQVLHPPLSMLCSLEVYVSYSEFCSGELSLPCCFFSQSFPASVWTQGCLYDLGLLFYSKNLIYIDSFKRQRDIGSPHLLVHSSNAHTAKRAEASAEAPSRCGCGCQNAVPWAITSASQGLHWQESGVRWQSWVLSKHSHLEWGHLNT